MLTPQHKKLISDKVQEILQSIAIVDDELPVGEISFILHVDGKEDWSWANIRNESMKHFEVPTILIRNLTVYQ